MRGAIICLLIRVGFFLCLFVFLCLCNYCLPACLPALLPVRLLACLFARTLACLLVWLCLLLFASLSPGLGTHWDKLWVAWAHSRAGHRPLKKHVTSPSNRKQANVKKQKITHCNCKQTTNIQKANWSPNLPRVFHLQEDSATYLSQSKEASLSAVLILNF